MTKEQIEQLVKEIERREELLGWYIPELYWLFIKEL